jgi:hypothetical protein
MPAPVLAAPLVIPFAEAIGVSIAALGMAKATDKVNEFIQENPEQSIKIFQMIMPSQGIANALKNKSSEGDEDLSEDIDVEVEEKPKKLTGKEKGMRIKEAIRRARAGKGNYSSPDAEGSAVDIRGSVIREAEDMGLADKDLKDKPYKEKGYDFRDYIPRGAYKKKYADGGSIGIEVLFGPKVPAAPSQLVSESDILLGYRGDAAYRSGSEQSKSIGQGNVGSKASFGGGQGTDRSGRSEGAGGVNPNQYTSKQENINQIKAQLGIKDPNLLQKTFNKYNSLPFYAKGAINTMAPVELMKLFQVGNALNTGYNQIKNPVLTDEDITLEPGKLPELTLGMNDIPKFNFEEMTGITSQDPANMQLAKVFNTKEDLIGLGAAKDSFFDTLTPKGEALEKFRKNATSMNNPTGTFQEYKGLGAESQLDTLIGKGNKNATENEAVIRDALEKGFLENESDFINQKPLEKAFADGGRVGLFMGGDPLTGQALSIYNSMNSYGFDDQAIADALSAQGLYTAGGTTDTPDTTIQPIGFQSSNGGGGGGITELNPLNRPKGTPFDLNSLTKTKFGYNNALGRTIEGVKDFTGSMIDKFYGSKIGEGITSGATKFKNMAFTPMMALMQKRNPLNPSATNYNPNLQKQMDFLEGTTGTRVFGTSDNLQFEDAAMIGRDPNSGLAKYGPGSVLSGQNVVSGFGTNDYEQQIANYVEKIRNRAITKTLTKFQQQKLDAAMAELGREKARQEKDAADRARAANADVYAELDKKTGGKGYGDAGGFSTSKAGKEGAFGTFGEGRGRKDFSEGGLVTMFKEKR